MGLPHSRSSISAKEIRNKLPIAPKISSKLGDLKFIRGARMPKKLIGTIVEEKIDFGANVNLKKIQKFNYKEEIKKFEEKFAEGLSILEKEAVNYDINCMLVEE